MEKGRIQVTTFEHILAVLAEFNAPPLDDSFFNRAVWRMSKKPVAITVHIDPDLLAWFQALGTGYEQRMVAALRIYAEAHKDTLPEAV